MPDEVVICAASRTPMGSLMGDLARLPAPSLGGAAIRAALDQARVPLAMPDEVLMGCVLPAGLGQAPARQAAFIADLPETCAATTVNKMCGSGMKTVMLARDMLVAGSAQLLVAGGMESMSQAPHLIVDGRTGHKFGPLAVPDHMEYDGLTDVYSNRLMGEIAENSAQLMHISREAMDRYAGNSLIRARHAEQSGAWDAERCQLEVNGQNVSRDQPPWAVDTDRIAQLEPAFKPGGRITAASSAAIADGAAALVLCRRELACQLDLPRLARLAGQVSFAALPEDFPLAPVHACKQLLAKLGWQAHDVDLFEINEAFALVPLLVKQGLGLSDNQLNIHGGSCALGHPLGASGARILVTLVHALHRHQLRRGIAAICIGGGEACAVAVEVL